MALRRATLRPASLATAAVFGIGVLAGPLREARADEVSSSGKGIVGGALLGGEVVTIVESLVGVRSGWAYAIGAVLGAGGGGVGGYFVEQGSSDGRAPTYMLAGGLLLIIPAIVLTMNATRYMPEEGATEDRAPTAPAAEPGAPGVNLTGGPAGVTPPHRSAPPATPPQAPVQPEAPTAPPPQSLLDLHRGSLRFGVPVPDVRPVYTIAERARFGTRAETELRLPVLHLTF
jgi:hypothetical protein